MGVNSRPIGGSEETSGRSVEHWFKHADLTSEFSEWHSAKAKVLKSHNKLLEHEEHFGFSGGSGITEGTFSLKLALKRRREHGKHSYVRFVNLIKHLTRLLEMCYSLS